MEATLYKAVVGRGIEHDNHESDLYIPITKETADLIEIYGYKHSTTTFRDNLSGKMWYSVPFAYDPFWEQAASKDHEGN